MITAFIPSNIKIPATKNPQYASGEPNISSAFNITNASTSEAATTKVNTTLISKPFGGTTKLNFLFKLSQRLSP